MGTRLRRVSDRTFNDNEASALKDKRYLSAKRTRIAIELSPRHHTGTG